MEKHKVRMKILQTVLAQEISKGHLKWTIAGIARLNNISRALIYYHFGKTKMEILTRCLDVISEDYFALSGERAQWISEGRIEESLLATREKFLATPALAVFYQRWRTTPSLLQKQLIQIEKKYQAKLRKVYPHLSLTQIIMVHGIFHGLITAPFMTKEAMREAITTIARELKLK